MHRDEFFKGLSELEQNAYDRLGIIRAKQTCYEVTGLNPAATEDEIKKTKRTILFTYHPDKLGNVKNENPAEEEVLEAMFKILSRTVEAAVEHTKNGKKGDPLEAKDLKKARQSS